jgi:hypothetical protein
VSHNEGTHPAGTPLTITLSFGLPSCQRRALARSQRYQVGRQSRMANEVTPESVPPTSKSRSWYPRTPFPRQRTPSLSPKPLGHLDKPLNSLEELSDRVVPKLKQWLVKMLRMVLRLCRRVHKGTFAISLTSILNITLSYHRKTSATAPLPLPSHSQASSPHYPTTPSHPLRNGVNRYRKHTKPPPTIKRWSRGLTTTTTIMKTPQIDLVAILAQQKPQIDLQLKPYNKSTRHFLISVTNFKNHTITIIKDRRNTHTAEMKRVTEKT